MLRPNEIARKLLSAINENRELAFLVDYHKPELMADPHAKTVPVCRWIGRLSIKPSRPTFSVICISVAP